MRANPSEAFHYVYSCDLQTNVQIKVCEFEGIFRDVNDPTRRLTQLFAEVTVYCNNRQIGYPVSTSYHSAPDAGQLARHKLIQSWNEWLTLPIRYCDLSRDAFLHITVWEMNNDEEDDEERRRRNSLETFSRRLVAQSQISLFSKRGILKSRTIDVQMNISTKLDPFTRTPETWKYSDTWNDNIELLFKQVNRQSRGLLENVQWLDPFTSRRVETIRAKHKYLSTDRNLFIVIEMASIRFGTNIFEVLYYEDEAKNLRISASLGVAFPYQRCSIADPELGLESLAELKHSAMTRRNRDVAGDRQLKPNKQAKDRLEAIIKLPSSQGLTREQRDLVWKFRYYLREDPKALNKYLRSVNWDQPQEEQAALALMNDWALIEAEDALELLSRAFTHPTVRAYAVSRLLDAASPEQVLLYLPQLVQALKYEPVTSIDGSFVAQPLIATTTDETLFESGTKDLMILAPSEARKAHGDLATFLIDYATTSPKVSNFLFWYLKVEIESTKNTDEASSKMYTCLQERLLEALIKRTETRNQAESLQLQKQFVEDLKVLAAEAKSRSGRKDVKEAALKTILSKAKHMTDLKGVTLPLDPTIRLAGVIPDTASMFDSQLTPIKLSFKVVPPVDKKEKSLIEEYTCIFKQGDDLRQDQLVIQMIRLMDSLFKKDQLDLKLTPYAVLATGVDEGFVQFVKARPLRIVASLFSSHRLECIKEAMKEMRPGNGPFGIEPNVVDNYVRSLAGYSVISYVLGIGDRHLDNLLICENGKIFHVDFGFILGRDPKPMPPPMKLTSEMIQAMGGIKSKQFHEFCQYCDAAYRILRRHSNVLLNLFSLMLDAGIPDIASEADKAVFKIEQRLRLELSDEAASKHILGQIETSMNAKMAVISDFIHDVKLTLF